MSTIQMELSEQASDLGFRSIEEAEANGYKVDYNGDTWVLKPDLNKAHEEAHAEWVKRRDNLLERLDKTTKEARETKDHELADFFEELYLFIKEGEI